MKSPEEIKAQIKDLERKSQQQIERASELSEYPDVAKMAEALATWKILRIQINTLKSVVGIEEEQ